MPRILIDDLDDPRIAIYRSLKATNRTRDLDQFVVEGERLVDRLIDSRFPLVSVLLAKGYEARLARPIPEDVPAYVLPDAMLDGFVGFPFHRGILGCGERRPWPSLESLLADPDRPAFLVICPKLSNPENLGALARIGDVFGIDAILAGPECPDPLSRRVLRVSMGAALRLPVIVEPRPIDAAARLADSAWLELIAAVADPDAESFECISRPRRVGLVLGDEHEGIDPEWLAVCRRAVTVPMRPGASSLNVAVAAGILIYHFARPGHSIRAEGAAGDRRPESPRRIRAGGRFP
jgi:tRNA G18 (ribose-2'-O)-methylase SpoU